MARPILGRSTSALRNGRDFTLSISNSRNIVHFIFQLPFCWIFKSVEVSKVECGIGSSKLALELALADSKPVDASSPTSGNARFNNLQIVDTDDWLLGIRFFYMHDRYHTFQHVQHLPTTVSHARGSQQRHHLGPHQRPPLPRLPPARSSMNHVCHSQNLTKAELMEGFEIAHWMRTKLTATPDLRVGRWGSYCQGTGRDKVIKMI